MVRKRTNRLLSLAAGLALALPVAAAEAQPAPPVAHAAGSGAAALDPPIVGVPIQRTDVALSSAADAIDAGNGAQASGPLTASRRYLLRSYNGAKYLIANAPPAPAADGSANPHKFRKLALRAIRASRSRAAGQRGWIKAHASGAEGGAGPAFADAPTAVFDVFTSQFNAATAAVGMAPDTKGELLAKVKTTLNTAIVLRNRLVKVVHAAAPPAPAPATDGRVHARASGAAPAGGSAFDAVMPGLTVLLDAELQQMQAAAQDSSVPSDAKAILTSAVASDKQIETLVNQWWPPAPAGADD
jgi:hypothetical protein